MSLQTLTTRQCYVFMCDVYQEDVDEDILCTPSLPTKTMAPELFKSLDDYTSGKLKWSFCTAMTGRLSGLTAQIKEVAPECESTHDVIHREMLARRKMPPELNSVLNDVVEVINHVKALNSHLLEQLCDEMDMEPYVIHRNKMVIPREITGRVFEQRYIWHVSNISRDFGWDWVWALILPAGTRSCVFANERVWAKLPNHKRSTNCQRDKPGKSNMSVQEEDQLLEITSDRSLKSMFETTTLD